MSLFQMTKMNFAEEGPHQLIIFIVGENQKKK